MKLLAQLSCFGLVLMIWMPAKSRVHIPISPVQCITMDTLNPETWSVDSTYGALHVQHRTKPPMRIQLGNEDIRAIYEGCSRAGVAVVANQTSVIHGADTTQNTHLVDSLLTLGIDVRKVFAPEHGFRGNAHNGAHIADNVDPVTGLPILSLHGKHKKPSAESLSDVRIIIFDIQDVGARFFTYLSTLFLVMEAAAENGKVVVVLDRPNPHGHQIAGPVIQSELISFIGQIPVPVLHGMTLGEMAQMINGEGWLTNGTSCDLVVIPCKGYAHSDAWYPPIAPSPNLPTRESIALYPSLCPFEPTVVSVGRGTSTPFEVIGMPSGSLGSFVFTPQPVVGASPNPKHKGTPCYGQNLRELGEEWTRTNVGFDWSMVADYGDQWRVSQQLQAERFLEEQTGNSSKDPFVKSPSFFDKLVGNDGLRAVINGQLSYDEYVAGWLVELREFDQRRTPYLLYPVQRKGQDGG